LIVRDFQSAFERCDLILGPVAPTTAFEIGAQVRIREDVPSAIASPCRARSRDRPA
jgi:Asp-tRNA(Asn)/Glu-tRNA(Gln) amidotransferase A subunit family amidase